LKLKEKHQKPKLKSLKKQVISKHVKALKNLINSFIKDIIERKKKTGQEVHYLYE
jgi:hypothetical protein